jgi:hypothetical protein
VDGIKRVESIPADLVEHLMPLVEEGRAYRDAVAEIRSINAQLLRLWRLEQKAKKAAPGLAPPKKKRQAINNFDRLPRTPLCRPHSIFGRVEPDTKNKRVLARTPTREVSVRLRRRMRRKSNAEETRELKRKLRTTAGFLTTNFNDDLLGRLTDPRSRQGRGWKDCRPLLKAVQLGLTSGRKGLGAVEKMTAGMFGSVRKMVGILRTAADTTMRDLLVELDPEELSELIYVAGYDAWDRRAIHRLDGFPFHAISCDGKYPTIGDVGDSKSKNYKKSKYLQVHHDTDGNPAYGEIRTINSAVVTAVGRPVVGSVPVPGNTNEQTTFKKAFGDLVRIYGRRFKLVMYDAGAASEGNAVIVRKAGKHYLFQIADERWVMHQTAALLLRDKDAQAFSTNDISENERVERELTMMTVGETRKNLTMWKSVRTIFRIVSKHFKDDKLVSNETRYFVTSMDATELRAEKWLELIILRWGIETVHQILDMEGVFEEDDHPWITKDARGALSVGLLRRLVLLLMTMHKHIHLRSEENRDMPWPDLVALVRRVLEWGGADDIFDGLRTRNFKVPPALA